MNIEGIVTVDPSQTELMEDLALLMGEAFETEPWTATFLEGIRAKDGQGLEISTTVMRTLIESGAPVQRVYCTPDGNACAIAYRKSEQEQPNDYYEQLSMDAAKESPCLGDKQAGLVFLQQTIMWPVSDFEWYPDVVGDADYIHLVDLGVRVSMQHQGKLSELMNPILAYADANKLPVFLETYSKDLEGLYKHYGFETLEILESPTTPVKEHCMMRNPA